MSGYEKAMRILAYMARVHRPAHFLEVRDVLDKVTEEELNFYYQWLCQPL